MRKQVKSSIMYPLMAAVLAIGVAQPGASAATYTGTMSDDDDWGGDYFRDASVTFDPNNGPVTITGSVDVTNMSDNGAILIGLVDRKSYVEEGNTEYMAGAYAYFGKRTTLDIGPSDGWDNGELIQIFGATTQNVVNFTAVFEAGTVSVTFDDGSGAAGPYTDDDGSVKGSYSWDEFEFGAILGIDFWDGAGGSADYSITVVPEPASAALLGLGGGLLLLRRRGR